MRDEHPPRLSVLRLGHRRDRDKRITSHLGLTARAFGADEVILSGDDDSSALETWRSVTERFGGDFNARYEPKPLSWLRKLSNAKEATIVHLTMYGEPWEGAIGKIPSKSPVVIVVGGTKVPPEVFQISDLNVSVGNQPHSEVAALAVFLNSLVGPLEEFSKFSGAQIRVKPSPRNKLVISDQEE